VKTLRAILLGLGALLVTLTTRAAVAAVPLCLEVTAPPDDLRSFDKLVRLEIDRHPSHRVVESDCQSHLRVELFDAAGVRFITAQIDKEIPARFSVKEAVDLAPRLEDAIRLVLHNDPASLVEDMDHLDAVQRFGQAIIIHGRTAYRLESFEAVSRSGTGIVTIPGLALGVTRGSGNLQVLGRLYGGGAPGDTAGTDQALQVMAGLDAGLTFELFDNKAMWTPYVSGCAGVQFVRYAGREHAADTFLTYVDDIGATLSARLGVRFFRGYDFDLDLFAQAYVPLFVTKDVDNGFFGAAGLYTPSVQLGLGVGF
jgi:hypothetical protein